MKKTYFIRTFAMLLLVAASIFAINSCKENVGPTDLLAVPTIVPVSSIELEVYNSKSDSLKGYDVEIKDPSGKITKLTDQQKSKIIISDVVNGPYTLKVSKGNETSTEFYLPEEIKIVVSIPAGTSIVFPAFVMLTKANPFVKIDPTVGGALNFGTPVVGAAPLPTATIAPGTVVTDAAGNVVTDLKISATPVAPSNLVDKKTGDVQIEAPSAGAKVAKSIEFLPSGLQFTKPIRIGIFVGDIIEGLDAAEALEVVQGLDLSTESAGKAPEFIGMSDDGKTAFFDIYHFSSYNLKLPYELFEDNQEILEWHDVVVPCNTKLKASASYKREYLRGTKATLAATGNGNTDINFLFEELIEELEVPGSRWNLRWRYVVKRFKVKHKSKGEVGIFDYVSGKLVVQKTLTPCHNQGGN